MRSSSTRIFGSGNSVLLLGLESETRVVDVKPHAAKTIAHARHTGRRTATEREPKTVAPLVNKQADMFGEEEFEIPGDETGDDKPEIWRERQ